MKSRNIVSTLLIFAVLSVLFVAMRSFAPAYHFVLLEAGNAVLAVLTIVSFFIVQQQIDKRPQAFVRGVYSASLLKLMVCMFAMLIYIFINRNDIHKGSIFVLMGVYILYTGAESLLLARMAKEKQDTVRGS